MSIFGSLVALLKADTTAWTKGFSDAGKDVERFEGKTKGIFKALDAQFGKGSQFGKTMEVLRGGGAVAGLSMAGDALSKTTAQLVEMKNAINAGTASYGDMFEKIAAGLPVIGKFWEAGRNIREAYTGENAQMAADLAEANQIADAAAKKNAQAKQGKSFLDNLGKGNDQLNQQIVLDGLSDEFEKRIQAAKYEAENATKELNAQVETQLLQNGRNSEQIKAAQAERLVLIEQKKNQAIEQAEKDRSDKTLAEFDKYYEDAIKQSEAAAALLEDQAKQVEESVKTPMEKAQEEVAKVQNLLDDGLISRETADKALAKIDEEAQKKQDGLDNQDLKTVGAREIRFLASVPGLVNSTKDKAVEDTAKNTANTVEAVQEVRDAIKQNLSFEMVDVT